MSHIHVPDGILPLWLVAFGWLVTAALVGLSFRRVGVEDWTRRLPLLAVIAALMVVGMTVEIVPIGYHINLSVVAGIVLGPALGFIAALIVNIVLAMFGHGGITVMGLNTLVIGSEVVAGYLFFRLLLVLLSSHRVAWAAGVATVLALITSTVVMIGVVAVASSDPAALSKASAEALGFRNPFDEGLLSWELFAGGDEASGVLDPGTFARIVFSVGSLGWLLEATISGLLVGYVARLRPEIVLSLFGGRRQANELS